MKSFKQFLLETINISGDFNGNLYVNSSTQDSQNAMEESFFADMVWDGKLYRIEVEGNIMSKNELTEHIQSEYPGAIVHNVYPPSSNSLKIKSAQRYQPERLSWSE
jgi:hypothetical protein